MSDEFNYGVIEDRKQRIVRVIKDKDSYLACSNSLGVQIRLNSIEELRALTRAFKDYVILFKMEI